MKKEITDTQQEYEQLRGEYLSLMAKTEYELSFLITEMLEVSNHSGEFQEWFIKTPIPFDCKASLFMTLVKENTQLDQFRTLISNLRAFNNFRNTLAHSFSSFDSVMTARGERIHFTKVSLNTLKSQLGQLKEAENLILNLLASCIEGNIPPISADDFADGVI